MTDSTEAQRLLKRAMERPGVAVVMKLLEQFQPTLSRARPVNRQVAATSVSSSTS